MENVKQRKTLGEVKKPYVSYIGNLVLLSTVIFMFGAEINSMSFLGYPLAYYMTAQGSLLAFVLLIFWFANKQESIDEECGFHEREDS